MKPRRDEASAILDVLWDIAEDTEEIKMVHGYHHYNLLTQEKQIRI